MSNFKKSIPGGLKDENGVYVKLSEDPNVSIDDLLLRGLVTIDLILKKVKTEALASEASRNSVMNLKDCMSMLESLKKREQDLLDSLTDEQLRAILKEREK